MSHSHLAIRHLVRKLEMSGERKSSRVALPGWLVQLVEDLSQHFEPFTGVARVGYECQQGESGWEVSLFLGDHEIIGGSGDGELRPVNFRFDVKELSARFDEITALYWNAFPASRMCFADDGADLSCLTIEGVSQGQVVRVQIHAGPPESAGPGLREHIDGRVELA